MNILKKRKKKTFPCQGTKISHARTHGQKKKKNVCMNEISIYKT